jgi:hypothetical protein
MMVYNRSLSYSTSEASCCPAMTNLRCYTRSRKTYMPNAPKPALRVCQTCDGCSECVLCKRGWCLSWLPSAYVSASDGCFRVLDPDLTRLGGKLRHHHTASRTSLVSRTCKPRSTMRMLLPSYLAVFHYLGTYVLFGLGRTALHDRRLGCRRALVVVHI